MEGEAVTSAPPPVRVLANPCTAPGWKEKHWFPVASVHELDPMRPTPVTIDGLALVVWHVPQEGKVSVKHPKVDDRWTVMADACPHRLAPLSEGRIEPKTGRLQCAYHGWEFDAAGKCHEIPSADIETCERACEMKRSCAKTYPSTVALGLVWVWLGDSVPPASASPTELVKGSPLEEEVIIKTYTRDLPYGYDTLLENLIDPAHVPFAHHGLQGTRDDARPITMEVVKNGPGLLGFQFEDFTIGMKRHGNYTLLSPFLSYYRCRFEVPEKKSPFKLNFCCIPVSPGNSRIIMLYSDTPGEGTRSKAHKMPAWVMHWWGNRFLDSDLAFLHFQERTLRSEPRSAEKWQTGYFMPAKCDSCVVAWRRWLTKEGARCMQPEYAKDLPPTPPREILLDRYSQHVAHCKQCQSALEKMTTWQWRVGKAGVAAWVLDRLQLGPSKLWLAAQVLALGAVMGLQTLKQSFYFNDYKHYLR